VVRRRARRDGQGHVLILVQNLPVPFDRRVWQEALALVRAGYGVHVICPATSEHPLRRETLSGVSVYRYSPGPEARRFAAYLVEYAIAIFAQLRIALRIRLRCRVRIVHICNPPDLLFLVALPLMALGARLIYDHHDACPELMIAKGLREDGWPVRLVRLFERLTYRLCQVSVETNESYRQIALGRGRMSPEDVFVVRSAPEGSRFAAARPDDKWRFGRAHLVGYVGVMGLQDGLDYLIDAAALIILEWQRHDIQFVLVGSGPEFPRLAERVRELRLGDQVLLTGRLPDDDLGAVLATADVCVNPDEANRMNDISTMNKVLEYMALGKPMVQFDLREGRFSAGGSSLYATGNDARSLARCILQLVDDPVARARMGETGRRRLAATLSWELQIPHLLAAYARATPAFARPGRRVRRDAARPVLLTPPPAAGAGRSGRPEASAAGLASARGPAEPGAGPEL
jgi:glycosyltransferase involved in cell wall biosynthesis